MTAGESKEERTTVALIGLRGSGKSTVGRVLAELLGGAQIDTDALVVEEAGRSIAALFSDEGEAEFRRREAVAVARAVAARPAVISAGGGAVLSDENVSGLRRVARLVWLKADPETLVRRLAADPAGRTSRPSLTGLSSLEEMRRVAEERAGVYAAVADFVVDTEGKTCAAVAREIHEWVMGGGRGD